jgi:hypothetical protein
MEAAGKRWILYPSRTDRIRIWFLACLHYGSSACAENHLKRDIQTIKDDPYSFWVGGGDYGEYISPKDTKRWNPQAVASWLRVADLGGYGFTLNSAVRDLLKPIADKCLGLGEGNHEVTYQIRTEQQDRHPWLCQELKVRNLRYCAFIDIIFRRKTGIKAPKLLTKSPAMRKNDGANSWTRRLFYHHGAGGAQTSGGKLNRLIRFMDSHDADIYFVAHGHEEHEHTMVTTTADVQCERIREHERHGILAGSYLKTYAEGVTTYGEVKGYRPVRLGAAGVTIIPDKQRVLKVLDI